MDGAKSFVIQLALYVFPMKTSKMGDVKSLTAQLASPSIFNEDI